MLIGTVTKENENKINDDTVEGACILLNKVGYIIDDKLKKAEEKKDTRKLQYDKVKDYYKVFSRLEELV
jgi:hypothetical protein